MVWWRRWIPSKNERELKRYWSRVPAINALEEGLKQKSDDALRAMTQELQSRFQGFVEKAGLDPKARVSEGTSEELQAERKIVDGALDMLLPEAFALVREGAFRVLGMRHYDVQLIGGMVLHHGRIAEMKTGEGKTLVATLPVFLNALAGRGVHLITVNEYLATRDARWMGQLYRFLGLEVGVVAHGMNDTQRQAAYNADITYGTNSEFGFDYLRDNMKLSLREYTQRGLHFAIVDEVDSILIDEARTPLIISGPAEDSVDKYARIDSIVPGLRRERDYTIDEKARSVMLTELGVHNVEQTLKVDNLYAAENIEILHHVNQALRAHALYRRDVDYMVEDGKVKIIDEFTGRVLDGRRWSDGLHQAVEAKEGVQIEHENQTLATITYQNYFRMFMKLCGMTGTAETEAEEFAKIYDLDVVVVPTHRPVIRDDADDLVYKTEREKFEAIAEVISEAHGKGQPALVGTVSVEKSEVMSKLLQRLKVPHNVLNAKYHRDEARIVAQAGRLGSVTIATNMAGRGTDIVLGGNAEAMAKEAFLAERKADAEEDPKAQEEAYQALLADFEQSCAAERTKVLEAGGLLILGTERHESRRIDNQLRGRAGRQGDPGGSRFFISLEDDLMRIFGGERIMGLMERMGMQEGEVIEHSLVNRSLENAQRRVEGHNFDIRKHLLEYDDVMNDQRRAVYKLRRRVIGADLDGTRELMLDLLEEVVIRLVDRACPVRSHAEDWDVEALQEGFQKTFDIELAADDLLAQERDGIDRWLFDQVEAGLRAREEEFSAEGYYSVSRIIYLQAIDMLWKDHLRVMDQLREGISLRSYAQKDPKHEYKREGFNLFAGMMQTIAFEVLEKTFRVIITKESEEAYQARLEAQRRQQQELMALGEGDAEAQDAEPREAKKPHSKAGKQSAGVQKSSNNAEDKKPQTVRRSGSKVGSNDLCPCGSGKKYKKCHMLSDGLNP